MCKKNSSLQKLFADFHEGAARSWRRLLEGHCGVVSLKGHPLEFDGIPSQVAALVPAGDNVEGGWVSTDWLVAGVWMVWAGFEEVVNIGADTV